MDACARGYGTVGRAGCRRRKRKRENRSKRSRTGDGFKAPEYVGAQRDATSYVNEIVSIVFLTVASSLSLSLSFSAG